MRTVPSLTLTTAGTASMLCTTRSGRRIAVGVCVGVGVWVAVGVGVSVGVGVGVPVAVGVGVAVGVDVSVGVGVVPLTVTYTGPWSLLVSSDSLISSYPSTRA